MSSRAVLLKKVNGAIKRLEESKHRLEGMGQVSAGSRKRRVAGEMSAGECSAGSRKRRVAGEMTGSGKRRVAGEMSGGELTGSSRPRRNAGEYDSDSDDEAVGGRRHRRAGEYSAGCCKCCGGSGQMSAGAMGDSILYEGKGRKKRVAGEFFKQGTAPEKVDKVVGGKKKRPANPWLQHLAKVRKANPGLSVPELAKKAKESY